MLLMFNVSGYSKSRKGELLGDDVLNAGRGTVGVSGRDAGFGGSIGIL